MRSLAPVTATVRIRVVREVPTRQRLGVPPVRRFEILAEDVRGQAVNIDRYVSLTTLDQWKASLCDQAMKVDLPLVVTFQDTGYFDKTIVAIERPTQQGAA